MVNKNYTNPRLKYDNLAKRVTKRNVTRCLVAFWWKIIKKCQNRQFLAPNWLISQKMADFRLPSLPDFHSIFQIWTMISPKIANFGIFDQFFGKNQSKIWKCFILWPTYQDPRWVLTNQNHYYINLHYLNNFGPKRKLH